MRKSGEGREIPPPLELECLKALWELGEANVKNVREVVTRRRNLAYTTVMTVLDRLARRGGVARRKLGRSFVYAPLLSRGTLRRWAVEELAGTLFDGSPKALARFIEEQDWSRAPEAGAGIPAGGGSGAGEPAGAIAPPEAAAVLQASAAEAEAGGGGLRAEELSSNGVAAPATPGVAQAAPTQKESPLSSDHLDAALL